MSAKSYALFYWEEGVKTLTAPITAEADDILKLNYFFLKKISLVISNK